MKHKLTRSYLNSLKPEDKQFTVADTDQAGFGVRVSPGGSKTYVLTKRTGRQVLRLKLGTYPDTTPEKARNLAIKALGQIADGIDPREKRATRSVVTLGDLMTAYCDRLESQGKYSAKSVRSTINKHIANHKRLWGKPAAEIEVDDCVKIVSKVEASGKLRQADKVRAYLKAAFSMAISARGKTNMPEAMTQARISMNPAAPISKVEGSDGTRDRVLTESELKAYWKRIKALEEPRRSILMLHMLTGGQRQQQLVRVHKDDIDDQMTLDDPKGRRKNPRKHTVPLIPEALKCIERLTPIGPWIFSCNGGQSPIFVTYLHTSVKAISRNMEAAGELEKGPFTAGALRATVETRLAEKRVSSDVLAQLMSHGLGGVQNKHYQRYDYHAEKLEALNTLHRLLEGHTHTATVTPLRASI